MLPQDQECAISEAACCGDLYTIAAHLLENVHEALLDCYQGVPCPLDDLNAYVTLGGGDDSITDALTVAFASAAASQGSVRGGMMVPLTLQRATFTVRLRESGWPRATVEQGVIVPPSPSLQNALARHAYAHGEKMYRTLLWMQSNRQLIPSSVRGCSNPSVGPLTPLSPTFGVIGFTVPVTVDVPFGGG